MNLYTTSIRKVAKTFWERERARRRKSSEATRI